jgi:hypothetical protein
MAIKIPILTEFDPKGLRQANAAFAELQTSLGSLGRNFAVAGAAIVGATALLGSAVMSASNFEAEFEGVNQVFKDAAGSVQAFAETAAETAGISATEALKAAKTFGLFATGAGLSTEEAAGFSTTLVQLAGDLGSFNDLPTEQALAAIQSGLMGSAEPLRVFGVFLDEDKLLAEALRLELHEGSGALSSQAKMLASYSLIMQETQLQQGDFVAYQDTLGNQLKTVEANFADLSREIGTILIPVITAAMPEIKAMADSIGIQLKEAIESVDWEALITSLVNLATFLIENAQAIAITVTALFALSTIVKTVTTIVALSKFAVDLYKWAMAQLATTTNIATGALTRFRTALLRTGAGIALVALGFAADAFFTEQARAADAATAAIDGYNNTIPQEFQRPINLPMPKMPEMPDFKPGGGISTAAQEAARAAAEAERAAADAVRAAAEANRLTAEEAARALAEIEREAQAERDKVAATEQAVLDKRQRAFESFADSVKNLFGKIKNSILSSFNLPTLGNSVNSITRNISKLLERTKNFARSISQLSGLGLNSALLQQVIQAGPMAGSQLAAALVSGGGSFISQINRAYGEFGDLAGGIAMTGTTGAFAGQQTINNYSIEVTGGIATGSDVGRAVVNAIRDFERTSGAAWRA